MKIVIGFLLLFLVQFGVAMYIFRKTESAALLALTLTAIITAIEVLVMFKLSVPLAALKYVFQ